MIDVDVVREYLLNKGHQVSRRKVKSILVDLGFSVDLTDSETTYQQECKDSPECSTLTDEEPRLVVGFESPRDRGPATGCINASGSHTILSLVERIESLEKILLKITRYQDNQRRRFYGSQQQGGKSQVYDKYIALEKDMVGGIGRIGSQFKDTFVTHDNLEAFCSTSDEKVYSSHMDRVASRKSRHSIKSNTFDPVERYR